MEAISDLLEQLHTLLDDYEELLEMDKDTTRVEDEITSRVRELKDLTREHIENSLDIPVILDGELLTFERAIKKKKYIDSNTEVELIDKVNIKKDGDRSYYYYLEKDIYHLDIEEENLMTAIKFINSKKEWESDALGNILNAIARICIISYGYRLNYEATIEKKLNVENIYTGSVFNNSCYSSKTYSLLDKLFQKIAEDYIERVRSSYDISEYIIHKIEDRWLIINKVNGATDVLDEQESKMCEVANKVTECFDSENVLDNNKNTDKQIENLHKAVLYYIQSKKDNM